MVLSGRFVTCHPLEPERDVADLYQLTHTSEADRQIWQYLPYGSFASQAQMLTWLMSMAGQIDPQLWTVWSHALERAVGMIGLLSIDAAMGRAEIGHVWYAPLVHRTKVNTEATYLLARYLFDDLGYRRVEWKCHSENQKSRQTALRMGFTYEGCFRQHMWIKGHNRDTDWFSMLDSEWPERKAKFERWLYTSENISLAALNTTRQ